MEDDDDLRFSVDSLPESGAFQYKKNMKMKKVVEAFERRQQKTMSFKIVDFDHVSDIRARLVLVERILSRAHIATKTLGFTAIYSKARLVSVYRKHCEIFNQTLERKRLRTLKTSFRCIRKTNLSSMSRTVMGLSAINSVTYNRATNDLVSFFNELETLGLVYELVFRRMKALRWKDEPRFMSVQHLVQSYLQTLWMKNPEKYEYVQDLVEGNTHVYAVLLDDITSWHYERVRRELLMFSLVKIKRYDKAQFRKLEKLIRILNKYNQKISKVHLLDFISKVNKIRPMESLLPVLSSLFSYYSSLFKQEAFNKLKLTTIKEDTDTEGKRKALRLLEEIFGRRKHQAYDSMPYRTLFPIGEEGDTQEAAEVLSNQLYKLVKRRLRSGLSRIREHSEESGSLRLTPEPEVVTTVESRYTKLLEKHAELLNVVIQRLFVQRLGLPFRKVVAYSVQRKGVRAKLADDLYNLFMKRYLAGFNQIRLEAEHVRNQKLMLTREGLSILDMFAKNRLNNAFSQIKSVLIELQTLQVSDVTDTTKIMFKMKDILNTSGNISGNLSGNWEDLRNMSRREGGFSKGGNQKDMSSTLLLKNLSPGAQRNPEKSEERKYFISKKAENSSLRVDESANYGSRRNFSRGPGRGDNDISRSASRTKAGKSQRHMQDSYQQDTSVLKGSQSRVLHGVGSNLSQDFTKSSSNHDMGIGSKGVSSAAFGVNKNGINTGKKNMNDESSLGQGRKSSNVTYNTTSKLQTESGYSSKGKSYISNDESMREGTHSKKKLANFEASDRMETHMSSDRFQGSSQGFRKEVSHRLQETDSRTGTHKNTTLETSYQQQYITHPSDYQNLDDSSKRSKVVTTKRRVTKTINSGKGLNTSGPLLE